MEYAPDYRNTRYFNGLKKEEVAILFFGLGILVTIFGYIIINMP